MSYREMISTTCAGCGVLFVQPDDPGRKREYHSNACKQRAYRRRGGRASGTRQETAGARQRREEREAWAREEARREQERQRSQRRRTGATPPQDAPEWTRPRAEDPRQAKRRRTCLLLWTRALHRSTPVAEADSCRAKAEEIRRRYGL